jgi:hypothetical protein
MARIERNENHAVVVSIVEAGLIKTPSEKSPEPLLLHSGSG